MTDTGVDGDRRRIAVVTRNILFIFQAVTIVGSDTVEIRALAQAVGVAHGRTDTLEFDLFFIGFGVGFEVGFFSIGVADCEHSRAAGNRCAHASLKGIAFDGVLIAEIAAERIERVRFACVNGIRVGLRLIVADHIVEVLAAQEDLGDFKVIGAAQRNRKTVIQIGVFLGESAGPVVAVDDSSEIEAGGLVSSAQGVVAVGAGLAFSGLQVLFLLGIRFERVLSINRHAGKRRGSCR